MSKENAPLDPKGGLNKAAIDSNTSEDKIKQKVFDDLMGTMDEIIKFFRNDAKKPGGDGPHPICKGPRDGGTDPEP